MFGVVIPGMAYFGQSIIDVSASIPEPPQPVLSDDRRRRLGWLV